MSLKDLRLVKFLEKKLGFEEEYEEEYDESDFSMSVLEGESSESMQEVLKSSASRSGEINILDYKERELFVRSCCDKMKAASDEVEKQKEEYRRVTDKLSDLEEIASMPQSDRDDIKKRAEKIVAIEERESSYRRPVSKITETQYREMERLEGEMPHVLKEIKKNEDFQMAVRRDLNLLEGEKGSLAYLKKESKKKARNSKTFAAIVAFAAFTGIILLAILQVSLRYDVLMGYYIVIGVTAIALTGIFVNYRAAIDNFEKADRQLNRAISLQNSAKVKYVNVTNLLDYQYSKYQVNNYYELNYMWEKFVEEKSARNHSEEVALEMEAARMGLHKLLSRYHIKEPTAWVYQPNLLIYDEALTDMRHNLIIQRQRLRKGIDFNLFNLEDSKKEVEQIIHDYPKFAKEILAIVEQYE